MNTVYWLRKGALVEYGSDEVTHFAMQNVFLALRLAKANKAISAPLNDLL